MRTHREALFSCLGVRGTSLLLASVLLGLSGFAQAQVATLSTKSVKFGNQAVGTTSAPPRSVTLSNTGTASLTVSSITPPSAPFADAPSGTTPCPLTSSFSLAPKASCTISSTFSPASTGSFTGSISIADNASNSPHTISLSGTGVLQATLTPPSSLNFGNQAVDTTSSTKTVTLVNNLNTALTYNGATAGGAFAVTTTGVSNACGATVPALGHCSIGVTFTPTQLGTSTWMLTVNDGANNSPQTISLTGTGVVQAYLSTMNLNFGSQGVGNTSSTKTVTLYNNLNTALTYNGATASGDFAVTTTGVSNACGATVPALGHCSIGVTFMPTQLGSRTGTLTVNNGANTSPQTASLTGTGTTSSLSTISVTCATSTVSVGATDQCNSMGAFPGGIVLNLTSVVRWSSSTKVASISNTAGSQGLVTGIAAGTTAIKASITVSENEPTISGSTTLTVTSGGQMTPTISWVPVSPITYGTPLGAAQLDATASAGGTSVPGTFAYTPGTGTILSAGNQMLSVTFTPTDTTHYTTATGSVNLTVNPATPTVTVTGGTFTYDGNLHAATATATGVGGVTVSGSFTFTYNGSATAPSNAATYTVAATFTSSNSNYSNTSGAGSLTISAAAPTVTVTGGTFTYDVPVRPTHLPLLDRKQQ
jgi:hypothetical protein